MEDPPRALFWLRLAFALGAITDGIAVIPLVWPEAGRLMWGLESSGADSIALGGYAGALMLGWTLLLVWAYRRPLERAFIAPLTLVVVAGLVVTELVLLGRGYVPAARFVPTWILQGALAALFGYGYFRARGWESSRGAERE